GPLPHGDDLCRGSRPGYAPTPGPAVVRRATAEVRTGRLVARASPAHDPEGLRDERTRRLQRLCERAARARGWPVEVGRTISSARLRGISATLARAGTARPSAGRGDEPTMALIPISSLNQQVLEHRRNQLDESRIRYYQTHPEEIRRVIVYE